MRTSAPPHLTHHATSRGPQLIAYADRFAGTLAGLTELLRGPLEGAFTGAHILPFYRPYDGADPVCQGELRPPARSNPV